MHNTRDFCKYGTDKKEKYNFHTAKKGRKKPNPLRQNFVQLSKILDRLEKVLKKLSKPKKRRYKDSNSDSE